MLSPDEVLRIAGLAKIHLSEEEVERFRKELSATLDFMSSVQNAVGSPAIEESVAKTGPINVFRPDTFLPEGVLPGGTELLAQAPRTRDNFVVSPQILGERPKK